MNYRVHGASYFSGERDRCRGLDAEGGFSLECVETLWERRPFRFLGSTGDARPAYDDRYVERCVLGT